MSCTYSVGCKDCKKHIWIAQGWGKEESHLYTGNKVIMKKFKDFLFDHLGHNLVFDDNCEGDFIEEIDGWEEIECD